LIARFQRLQEQLYLSHELLERNLLVSQQVARENQLGRQSWKSVNPWTIAGKRLKATAAILIFRSNESLRYKTASTAHAGSSPL
jgi:hypothetical protein